LIFTFAGAAGVEINFKNQRVFQVGAKITIL
jgi:hypothetical protein